ncbi:MAG: hypothetical protein KC593_18090 [Myxococcales bacterium]|nr:hypothetical protein [Myxococcales bacterium]MCB9629172.1 hypothetical protein [Sandaracinaceae bacterium]
MSPALPARRPVAAPAARVPRGRVGLLLCALLLGTGGCGEPGAVTPDAGALDPLGLHDWASAVVLGSGSRWVGERVPEHAAEARPASAVRALSELAELSVHAGEEVSQASVERALRGMEAMHQLLVSEGWPLPLADGGRGDTAGFDLYFVEGEAVAAGFDQRAPYTFLDRASTFARLPAWLTGDAVASCAASAYAEALLFSMDPAEAESWRRATAAYLTHRLTGRWGCLDEALASQLESAEAFVAYADEPPNAGGALLLTALAERHESTPGEFVASLWDLASQRTWEGEGYRGSPDLWEAIETVLRVSEDPLPSALETIALDRYLAGPRATPSSPAWARALEPTAIPSATLELVTSALRSHPPSSGELDPPLEVEPTGSYYALVHVDEAPPQSRLRVFLRAEFGVAWSLAVARLGSEGQELGRMSAPPRRGTPRSYLPVELGDDTAWVLVAVTNLGREGSDARRTPVPNVDATRSEAHALRLVFELVSDDPGAAPANPEPAE